MMRLEVVPLSSKFSFQSLRSNSSFIGRRQKNASFSFSVKASNQRSGPPVRTVGCPEPPWLVLPPSPPLNPFSGNPDLQMTSAGATEIPLSMRMVQLKKRLSCSPPDFENPLGADSPVVVALAKAISALVFMIGELQRSVMLMSDESAGGVDVDEAVLDRVSRDRRDSFVWLFRRVFFTSPDLVVSLLDLLAQYVSFSAQKAGSAAAISAAIARAGHAEKSEIVAAACAPLSEELSAYSQDLPPNRICDYLNWFDIGVKEGNLDPLQHEDEESYVDRRCRAYERTIAEGEVNSMILSNYAQFLYRIANDHDRAEQYFQWAVMAEPRDAEAMSRYASFLWEERGDITGAEEMFLEAVETEPWNHHHSSTYAWFLWKTGAIDTCYPLSLPPLPEV